MPVAAPKPTPLYPSSLRYWNRIATVTLALQPDRSSFVGQHADYFEQLGNGIEIGGEDGLTIKAHIKKDLGKSPNKCKITIHNLNRDTRAAAEKKPLYVTLRAGHDGVLRLLYEGNSQVAYSGINKTEWDTVIFVADGGAAHAHARMNMSYKGGVEVVKVLSDCASSMGLKLPPEAERSGELRQAFATGISLHGPTRDILTKILAPYGYNWSVQNGKLQIIKDGQTNGTTAILIDGDAGLIGSPERLSPEKKTGVSEVKFKVILYPEINPGCLVKIASRDIKGNFKITDVEHKIDTRGDPWETECKGKPI